MTAATVKTTRVSNALDAIPRIVQDARGLGGRVHLAFDTIEAAVANLDETGDIILMLPVPSHASLISLKVFNDDLDTGGTSGAVDVGLYNGPEAFNDTDSSKTAYAAYGVIDADCFASAITTLTAANTAGTEIRGEANGAANDISQLDQPLWKVAGLTSDPNRSFVVGITVTTGMTTGAVGTLSLVALHSS